MNYLFFGIAFVLVLLYFYLKKNYFTLIKGIPGDEPWVLIGNIFDYGPKLRNLPHFLEKLSPKRGPIHQANMFGRKLVFLTDPDLISEAFKNRDLDTVHQNFQKVIPFGLISLMGDEWKRHLRTIGPIFQNHKIQNLSELAFEPVAKKLVEKWKKLDSTKPYSVREDLCKTTLDIIGLAAFGYDFKNFDESHNDFAESINVYLEQIDLLSPMKFRWNRTHPGFEKAKVIISDRVNGLLEHAKKEKESLKGTFFYNLLDSDFSKEELRDEMMVGIFGGNETTSTSLSWGLIFLSKNSKVQDKLYQEIIDSGIDYPSFDDLRGLEYLNMVTNEIMRLTLTAPGTGRAAMKDTKIGEYEIPKGTAVLFNFIHLHMSPSYWENPQEFNPDLHWSKEAVEKRRKDVYYPFGGGHRACIGMNLALYELKYLLFVLLKNFTFKHHKGTRDEYIGRITTVPKDVELFVERR